MIKGCEFDNHGPVCSCPFCFGNDIHFKEDGENGWLECDDCDAKGPPNSVLQAFREKSEGNAVDDWNEREA